MGHGNQPQDEQPGATPVLRGSDGWDYYSIADKLLGQKALTPHNISRVGAEQGRTHPAFAKRQAPMKRAPARGRSKVWSEP